MEFQIKENYGNSSGGYLYFEADDSATIEQLKERAVQEVKKEWAKTNSGTYIMHTPTPPKPTIVVKEYKDKRIVKGGVSFSVKWR